MGARRWVLVVGVAVGLLAVGGGAGFFAGRLSAPDSSPAIRPAWPGEKVQHADAARYGNMMLRPIGLTCGMHWVSGTHAEWEARGQYCRLGVVVNNVDTAFHDLDTGAQRLVDATGKSYAPSFDAMRIRRQPDVMTIGAHDAVALDIWFDVPNDTQIVAARLKGDDDPSGIDPVANTPRPPGGVPVPLSL